MLILMPLGTPLLTVDENVKRIASVWSKYSADIGIRNFGFRITRSNCEQERGGVAVSPRLRVASVESEGAHRFGA
jgi:hypothetical protein